MPWIGNTSRQLLERIEQSVHRCFNSVKLRIVLKSDTLFPPNLKDSVTPHEKGYLIYKFKCKCDVCYIGRTTQRLEVRINQHIPSYIRNNNFDHSSPPSNSYSPSTIGRHLLDNPDCAAAYKPEMFSILTSSSNELQLAILEALLINRFRPALCIQKQFYTLLLFGHTVFDPINMKKIQAGLDGGEDILPH